MRRRLLLALGLVAAARSLSAQSSPFLPDRTRDLLVNEISGDLAFETIRVTTRWHKLSGSPDYFAVAREVEARARAAGLEDVRWLDQKAEKAYWACRSGEAWLVEGEGEQEKRLKIGSYAEVATSIADFSRPADVTAPLVDVGAGDRAADYRGREVRGKIVLASGPPSIVMEQAVWKRGAAGLLSWSSSRRDPLADHPDQIAWLSVPEKDGPRGEKTTFAFVISPRRGKSLSDRLRGEAAGRILAPGEAAASRPLRVRIAIDSSFVADPRTAMVEARIAGSERELPEIVLTAHLQETKSANDDQSGVANVLEIGRALKRLISEGTLPRPRRGIRFWWCDEIYSEYRYFADHPGEEKRLLVNLNQDMVGARQSLGGRVQYMARTPWSLPSYLSDVQESILAAVAAGNNGFLSAWHSGTIPPGVGFTRAVFAHLGSREPFHARAVPYFDSTDHLVFNDSWVGVPGTSLTNWPDEYIHSSDDDLWQIDPTQLKRNAVVVAATAWWLANAGEADVPGLAAFVAARGIERLGRSLAVGLERIHSSRPARDADHRSASALLAVALETETAAVRSVGALGGPPGSEAYRAPVALLEQSAREMQALLISAYEAGGGGKPGSEPDAVERSLSGRVPRKAAGTLDRWLELQRRAADHRAQEARDRRDREEREVSPRSSRPRKGATPPAPPKEEKRLSPLMQSAVLNWVDGRRDAAEIARRVCAEALAAGEWYYGETTYELVASFLEEQVRLGLLVWSEKPAAIPRSPDERRS